MTRRMIKICGLSTTEAVRAAISHNATHLGFIFFPKSPRHVALDTLETLAASVPPTTKKVGVFVDADDEFIRAAARLGGLDVVQLHGNESLARLAEVKAVFQLETWKAVGVKSAQDVTQALSYRVAADLLLFDAKPNVETAESLPGGNGLRFDWRLLSAEARSRPWGLSGGLDAASVGEAIKRLDPPLIDVSSGVEDGPGKKSLVKIEAFLKAALV